MFYNECTLEEILAFRDLEGEAFDFGEGIMKMEGLYGSEDAYYEMCIPGESGHDDEECSVNKTSYTKGKKTRTSQYRRKKITKKKMAGMQDGKLLTIKDNGRCRKRRYLSNIKCMKRTSNKKIRKYARGMNSRNYYKKIHDIYLDVLY